MRGMGAQPALRPALAVARRHARHGGCGLGGTRRAGRGAAGAGGVVRIMNRLYWPALILAWGAIAALLVASLPAKAQDLVNWGGTYCSIRATPGEAHIAEVTCSNVLTGGMSVNTGTLSLGGAVFQVETLFGPGREVDQFTLTPPEGLVAVPPVIRVPEGGEGVILIFAVEGMMMG